mmetsp:Transcript_160592/g.283163  ORF Transcript_160592/g.283163 Transcript_160592/m.283163 type:complete len:168 (+) Transcript_160592:134-637(+)
MPLLAVRICKTVAILPQYDVEQTYPLYLIRGRLLTSGAFSGTAALASAFYPDEVQCSCPRKLTPLACANPHFDCTHRLRRMSGCGLLSPALAQLGTVGFELALLVKWQAVSYISQAKFARQRHGPFLLLQWDLLPHMCWQHHKQRQMCLDATVCFCCCCGSCLVQLC